MKWTLVTGAAKHLGREIALLLAHKNHSVVIQYHYSEKEALDTVEEIHHFGGVACAIQGDFTTFASTKAFVEAYKAKFPDTKNLINNVGNYIIKKALATDMPTAYELFQTNVHVPFYLSSELASSIKEAKGSIINIGTSGIHSFRADERAPLYTATKIALYSITKSLAKELAPFSCRVNMVSPGQLEESVDLRDDPSLFPMGRAGTGNEVARMVAFLLEEESNYITGQNIEVAGGLGL
jgi:NAD(P)-dependent dehydrogenase (short-subunit alcohol dehydrogenase family)